MLQHVRQTAANFLSPLFDAEHEVFSGFIGASSLKSAEESEPKQYSSGQKDDKTLDRVEGDYTVKYTVMIQSINCSFYITHNDSP